MFKAFANLAPRTRLAVGAGVISWGLAGLYLSDRAEKMLGYNPSEQDKEELRKWAPRIMPVDKPDQR